jgi:hypothetical protein
LQQGGYISDFKQNYNLKKMQAMIPRDFLGASEAKEFMHTYQYYFDSQFFLQVNLIIPQMVLEIYESGIDLHHEFGETAVPGRTSI